QDKDFGKQTLHKGHANPLAEVTTSLKTYQHFTLEKAYLGEDFFWAFTPVAGDFIRIRFFTPVRIERYFFRSGNIEHPGDKLFNTSVEVLPFDNIQADKEALTEGREKTPKYHRTEDGFIRIGTFQNGIAEGEVDPTFGPLEAMRLTVVTDSPVWVILSEISAHTRVIFEDASEESSGAQTLPVSPCVSAAAKSLKRHVGSDAKLTASGSLHSQAVR
ncbi:hypothetical protein GBF38_009338, partial [Nibea albiflora]